MSVFKILPVLALFLVAGVLFGSGKVSAVGNDYLIDDQVFLNSNSMSAGDIWNFLNQQGSGLKNINVKETQEGYPNYNKTVNAAQVIYDAAYMYGVNPRVILATLQKEQSLIYDPTPESWQLNSAMGYRCPTTGVCDPKYFGLFNQIDNGTWQLRFNRERAIGNNSWWNPSTSYACGGSTSFYSPGLYPGNNVTFRDQDGVAYTSFVIATASTASLYCYTPHAFNNPRNEYPGDKPVWGTVGRYYSGSFNFVRAYELWWGSTRANAYNYSFVSATNSKVSLQTDEKVSNTIVLKNMGSQTWYADGSVPSGKRPTRLALNNYWPTAYADTTDPAWLGTRNQVKMTPTSVAPGQNATFTFKLAGPPPPMKSTAMLNFVPVIDGIGFMNNINMQMFASHTPPNYSLVSVTGLSNSVLPNEQSSVSVVMKNSSTTTWYADGSVPTGQKATRLAMKNYSNTSYSDTTDTAWLGTRNQVKMTPTSVAPGQNATFTFKFAGPYSSHKQRVHFVPVWDGVTFMKDISMFADISTPNPINSYSFVAATNPPKNMTPGSTANVSLTLKNTGNTVWRNYTKPGALTTRLAMTKPDYRNSAFYNSADAAWLAANQVRMNTATVKPGENAVFTFTWKAPTTPGTYTENFRPVIDGYSFLHDMGMQFQTTVAP